MFPITCNSIGDIIALIQVATLLAKSLDTSTGSASEYQDTIEQLDSAEHALRAVEDTIKDVRMEGSITTAARREITNCLGTIQKFRQHISWYRSLGMSSRGQWLKKFLWALLKKSDIVELRNKLTAHFSTIQISLNMLTM